MNGSLNVTPEAIEAQRAIRERRGARPGESFEALLDRFGVDLFVGIRLPIAGDPNRPWYYTTAHLEQTPGWLCVFRNLDSAVYLRTNERNRANLERVAAWYAAQGCRSRRRPASTCCARCARRAISPWPGACCR